jgi:hypothetical protein
MSTLRCLRWLGAVGLLVALGAGCGAITGENLSGTGGRGAGGSGGTASGGSGGTATGGSGAGGATTCGCNDIYQPVCGTDGVTYPNACSAKCLGYAGVAYQGPCVDAGSLSCNADSDCVLASSGCCGEMCVPASGVPLVQTIVCNVACPVFTAPTCGCVNHQCTLGSGTGGTGGTGGAGGTGGTGGTGDAGTASCSDLAAQYAAALPKAEVCEVGATAQCQQAVTSSLSPCGGCATYVNDATALNAIAGTWKQQGCANVAVLCPAITCLQPGPGTCVAGDGGVARCQVMSAPPPL